MLKRFHPRYPIIGRIVKFQLVQSKYWSRKSQIIKTSQPEFAAILVQYPEASGPIEWPLVKKQNDGDHHPFARRNLPETSLFAEILHV
jgi:hypothetical protein